MSLFVIAIIIVSAFMHAAWNLLAKSGRCERIFFGRALLLTAAVGFVPGVISEALTRSITPTAWYCLIGSGFFCAVYFFFLGRGYEDADFTIVYPLARAIPVLLIAFGDVLRQRPISTIGWLGMVLVVLGCFLTPLHSFKEFHLRRYLKLSRVWMLLAALGTVGYTLLDKIASEVVMAGPGTAARYCYLFFFFSFLFYFAFLKLAKLKLNKPHIIEWKSLTAAAVCNYGAYMLVVWAYQMSQQASYIVAFRQISVIIGVVIAFAIYKERHLAVRLTGVSLITVGLSAIGLS